MQKELTPEERRAIEDYLNLTRAERETFLELAQFAHRPHKNDPSIRNLDALIDLVRKRPTLVDMMKRAEWWEHLRRYLIMLGGIAGAILAVIAVAKTIAENLPG